MVERNTLILAAHFSLLSMFDCSFIDSNYCFKKKKNLGCLFMLSLTLPDIIYSGPQGLHFSFSFTTFFCSNLSLKSDIIYQPSKTVLMFDILSCRGQQVKQSKDTAVFYYSNIQREDRKKNILSLCFGPEIYHGMFQYGTLGRTSLKKDCVFWMEMHVFQKLV